MTLSLLVTSLYISWKEHCLGWACRVKTKMRSTTKSKNAKFKLLSNNSVRESLKNFQNTCNTVATSCLKKSLTITTCALSSRQWWLTVSITTMESMTGFWRKRKVLQENRRSRLCLLKRKEAKHSLSQMSTVESKLQMQLLWDREILTPSGIMKKRKHNLRNKLNRDLTLKTNSLTLLNTEPKKLDLE